MADDPADELYAVPPQEFMARRDELAAQARARGDRVSAKQITTLRKPSTSAWLANQLVRARPDGLRALFDLGAALREAQVGLRGDALRELSARRRKAVNALVREARQLAAERGRPVNETVGRELEQTLEAALVDDAAAQLLESGRLVSALTPSGGFDNAAPQLRLVRNEEGPNPVGRREAAKLGAAASGEAEATTAAARQRARDRVTEAETAARAARKELAARSSEHERVLSDVAEGQSQVAELQSRIDELNGQLRELKRQLVDVRGDEQQLRRALTAAERAARSAGKAADAARAELDAFDTSGM